MTVVNWARGLSVETKDPRRMLSNELKLLYEFSNFVMEETFDTFINHVLLHDVVYLFRRQSNGELVGFSCWRHVNLSGENIKIIIQGKLRILSSYRRIGLHVWATLWYWFTLQSQYPFHRIWFTAFVSLFNYVSLRKSISDVYIMNLQQKGRGDLPCIQQFIDTRIEKDCYEVDPDNPCLINVKIKIPPSTLQEFPDSFYKLPEAEEYIRVNPKYADGYDLSISYPFSWRNVIGLLFRAIEQTYWKPFVSRWL
jgi:hypothetical protein